MNNNLLCKVFLIIMQTHSYKNIHNLMHHHSNPKNETGFLLKSSRIKKMDLQSVFSPENLTPYKSLEFSTVSLLFHGADIFAKQHRASESNNQNKVKISFQALGYFDRYLI